MTCVLGVYFGEHYAHRDAIEFSRQWVASTYYLEKCFEDEVKGQRNDDEDGDVDDNHHLPSPPTTHTQPIYAFKFYFTLFTTGHLFRLLTATYSPIIPASLLFCLCLCLFLFFFTIGE
jgi:hypothetical protein